MKKKNGKLNTKKETTDLVFLPMEKVVSKIFLIRNKKVMLDKDLAELYGVETRVLNQAVQRNLRRFPSDFMFQLNKQEANNLMSQIATSSSRSQIVTLNKNLGSQFATLKQGQNIKYLPYVFTEQGVAMLSSVLNSERAILVNIQIIRTFTKIRELLATNIKLRKKIELMEKKYDSKFRQVFDVLKQLIMQDTKPKNKIGFKP